MKNKVFIVMVIILAVLSTGCKKKIEEKIAEKIIEDATGGKVDISSGTTVMKSEEGTTTVGENLKWPSMGPLKEIKATITAVMEASEDKVVMLMFTDMKKDYADDYLEYIKELGFESIFEITNEEGFTYEGQNDKSETVGFSYSNDGGYLQYSKQND